MSDTKNRRRRRKRSNVTYVLEIFLCLVAITAMGFAMIFLIKYHEMQLKIDELQSQIAVYEDPENPYLSQLESKRLIEQEKDAAYRAGLEAGQDQLIDDIRDALIESDSPLDTLKELYPDELIVTDSGEYLFFPVIGSLAKHDYDDADFHTLENKRIVYSGSAAKTETWIDVSKYQEKIKWDEIASDGIDGAIIRAGYRGYSKGDIMDDDTYETNIKGARKNNLKVGVYFLTQATSDEEAREEAKYVLDAVEGYTIEGPIVLDVEKVGGEDARGNALSMEDRTRYAKVFLDMIADAGYETMIYGNLKTFLLMLDLEQIEDYSKWFAGYSDTPYFPYSMDMWQYTDTGRVKGVSGDVDINIRFIR